MIVLYSIVLYSKFTLFVILRAQPEESLSLSENSRIRERFLVSLGMTAYLLWLILKRLVPLN